MFLVTVSFKHCEHQVVLRYKTEESMHAATEQGRDLPILSRTDDFGVVGHWKDEEVSHAVISHLPTMLKGRNAEDKIRARAQHDLKQEMVNDPTLEFIVDRNPFFGRK